MSKEKQSEYLGKCAASTYYVKAVSMTNPLRAISSYKAGELRDMVVALKILDAATAAKKTKPQMYETILQSL